jgi:hypothetical protein
LGRPTAIQARAAGNSAAVPLDRLPDWDWSDVCAHLKCSKCGSVGWVDPRPIWCEVVNYNKGIS